MRTRIVLILLITVFLVPTVFFLTINKNGLLIDNGITAGHQDRSYNFTSVTNSNTNKIFIKEPTYYKDSFIYDTIHGAKFVLYEDFPVQINSMYSQNIDLKVASDVDYIWAKFVPNNNANLTEKSGTVLRIFGAVKPFVPTLFNQTLYVKSIDRNGSSSMTSIPIVKNTIMQDMSVIRENTPIKYKNEIMVKKSTKFFSIFGVVYDPESISTSHVMETNPDLAINIEPVGMMSNGIITKFPSWINMTSVNLPLSLKQNQPAHYVFFGETSNAPPGTYEIAIRETIGNNSFIETVTFTVLDL